MDQLPGLGKLILLLGLILVLIGGILILLPKIPWLGRLPGDILIKGDKTTFYFPLATSILISILITLLLYLFRR